jgi:curli biogenesis system outer membrane secretion channel CsgG
MPKSTELIAARLKSLLMLAASAALCALGGCLATQRGGGVYALERPSTVKPVVAIASFNNKAGFSGQWNLGDGMADMLMTRLLDTGEVTVLERQEIGSVIDEIVLQGQKLFRREGAVQVGRLKGARYLVVGSITDFTVTDDASGWFSSSRLRTWGRGSRSKVSLHLRISDVESGEVLGSVKGEASAYAGWFGADVDYKQFSFGGNAFSRTPLGKATEKALGKAVKKILRVLPDEGYPLSVAHAAPDYVIINAGADAGIKVGYRYIVRKQGREITDPATGDLLEVLPGKVCARIEVYQVNSRSSHARIDEGAAERGDLLSRE